MGEASTYVHPPVFSCGAVLYPGHCFCISDTLDAKRAWEKKYFTNYIKITPVANGRVLGNRNLPANQTTPHDITLTFGSEPQTLVLKKCPVDPLEKKILWLFRWPNGIFHWHVRKVNFVLAWSNLRSGLRSGARKKRRAREWKKFPANCLTLEKTFSLTFLWS